MRVVVIAGPMHRADLNRCADLGENSVFFPRFPEGCSGFTVGLPLQVLTF